MVVSQSVVSSALPDDQLAPVVCNSPSSSPVTVAAKDVKKAGRRAGNKRKTRSKGKKESIGVFNFLIWNNYC